MCNFYGTEACYFRRSAYIIIADQEISEDCDRRRKLTEKEPAKNEVCKNEASELEIFQRLLSI